MISRDDWRGFQATRSGTELNIGTTSVPIVPTERLAFRCRERRRPRLSVNHWRSRGRWAAGSRTTTSSAPSAGEGTSKSPRKLTSIAGSMWKLKTGSRAFRVAMVRAEIGRDFSVLFAATISVPPPNRNSVRTELILARISVPPRRLQRLASRRSSRVTKKEAGSQDPAHISRLVRRAASRIPDNGTRHAKKRYSISSRPVNASSGSTKYSISRSSSSSSGVGGGGGGGSSAGIRTCR